MAVDERVDPYRSYNFRVEFDGVAMNFSEVDGLSSDGDAVEYREGTDAALTVRKLLGLRKYSNITLRRGYTQKGDLWAWYANVQNGDTDRRSGQIVLMDEQGTDVLRWNVENAWPNKIEGPSFKAAGNDVAIEAVELVHEGLTLEPA